MAGTGSMTTTHLASIPSHLLSKFVHHVIDGLCGGASASYQHECSLDKFWLAGQEVKGLARDITAGTLTQDQASNVLSCLGDEGVAKVWEAVTARRQHITQALLRQALTPTTHLTDFDWNVRVAVSSSSVLDLKQPLLSLHLHTASSQGRSDKLVEMRPAELDALLVTLREAQASLNDL